MWAPWIIMQFLDSAESGETLVTVSVVKVNQQWRTVTDRGRRSSKGDGTHDQGSPAWISCSNVDCLFLVITVLYHLNETRTPYSHVCGISWLKESALYHTAPGGFCMFCMDDLNYRLPKRILKMNCIAPLFPRLPNKESSIVFQSKPRWHYFYIKEQEKKGTISVESATDWLPHLRTVEGQKNMATNSKITDYGGGSL